MSPALGLGSSFKNIEAPSSASQGQFFRVSFESPQLEENKISFNFLDTTAPCHSQVAKEGYLWECLVPVPANAPVGPQTLKLTAWEGLPHEIPVDILQTDFPVEKLSLPKEKKELLKPSKERDAELKILRKALGTQSPVKHWAQEWAKPVNSKGGSAFGLRRELDGKLRENYYHRGLDLGAKEGTPIVASNTGTVVLAGHFIEEGNMVALDHGHGVMSIYLHCSVLNVKMGRKVKRGQVIAKVGSTGVSNSPHVHFGIYIHDVPIDPIYWLGHAPN